MAYKYVFGAAVFMSTIQNSLWAISHMFTVLARLVVGVMRGLKSSRVGLSQLFVGPSEFVFCCVFREENASCLWISKMQWKFVDWVCTVLGPPELCSHC